MNVVRQYNEIQYNTDCVVQLDAKIAMLYPQKSTKQEFLTI